MDIIVPTGINVCSSGANVYVSAYDTTRQKSAMSSRFSVGSGGALLRCVRGSPFAAGVLILRPSPAILPAAMFT